jgi:hypothetical protein
MNNGFDRFISILLGTLMASFVAYLVSGVLHSIWMMWTN